MEGIRIEKEIKGLEKERKELSRLLAKDSALREQVASEIDADSATFGDDRRTLIKESQRAVLVAQVVNDPITIVISKKYWARSRQGHGLDLSNLAFKDGDGLLAKIECRTTDNIIVICDNGRVCSIAATQMPSGKGDGVPLTTLIEVASGAKIVHVLCYKPEQALLIATSAGYGFTCTAADMIGRTKAGKQFITVDKETILAPIPYNPSPQAIIASVSAAGRLLVFLLSDMKHLSGGGKGVIIMGLAEGDTLAATQIIYKPELKVVGMVGSKEQQQVKLTGAGLQEYFGARARGGKNLPMKIKPVRIE